MQIFNSGSFWFVEGILFCVVVLALRAWSRERAIPLTWWKWVAFGFWVLLAGFTLAFVGTSLGEGEPTAAVRGGLMFGLVSVIAAVALWRVWMIGAKAREQRQVAKS
jgi:hypothetical protein